MNGADTMVRGWCPGALRPMLSGDGLIVRLRISCGIVDVALARQIARWSHRWGNGQIDLSNRANLQLRGLSARYLPNLHDVLRDWDLLDREPAAEAVRNVISSPLAGLDPNAVLDIRPIVKDLELRLAGDATLRALPAKFGFAIDDGGSFNLDAVPVDIRLVAHRSDDGPEFDIHLPGATQNRFGPCRPDAVADVAETLARVFLSQRMGRATTIRRMRDLVSANGAESIADEAGLAPSDPPRCARNVPPSIPLGAHPLGSAGFLGVGLPFGRITADDLAELAAAATVACAQDLRLTPWRAILVPVPSIASAHALASRLPPDAFILDTEDPRLRIAACPGAPSCIRSTTAVRADAATLASGMALTRGSGIVIHISGCEKGCAHPQKTPVTLVARDGRYDLVRDGVASGSPALRDLTLDQAAEHVRSILLGQPQGIAA